MKTELGPEDTAVGCDAKIVFKLIARSGMEHEIHGAIQAFVEYLAERRYSSVPVARMAAYEVIDFAGQRIERLRADASTATGETHAEPPGARSYLHRSRQERNGVSRRARQELHIRGSLSSIFLESQRQLDQGRARQQGQTGDEEHAQSGEVRHFSVSRLNMRAF